MFHIHSFSMIYKFISLWLKYRTSFLIVIILFHKNKGLCHGGTTVSTEESESLGLTCKISKGGKKMCVSKINSQIALDVITFY